MKTKIKTKTIVSSIGLSFLMLIFYALPIMAMANPASEYCVSVGGTLEIRAQEEGGQYGVCVFADGSECEEWALYNGECQKGLIQEEINEKNIQDQETIVKLREIYAKLNRISQKAGDRVGIQRMVELDQKVSAQDLGVEKSRGLFGMIGAFLVPETQDSEADQVGTLPDSKFYLFKEISRKIKMAFTFNSIKKTELQQKFANEKLIEIKKVYEKNQDPEQTEKLLEEYNEEVGLIAERIEKIEKNPKNQGGIDNLLNNLIDHLTKREKVVQDIQGKLKNKLLENKLSLEKYEKINNQLDWTVEKLGVKIKQLEGNRESLKERFVKIAEEQEGSEFKNFKNLEILKDLEEKMSSGTSEAIKEAREVIKEKFIQDMGEANIETRMNFQNYLDKAKGSSIRHLEIIQEITSEEIPPEIRAEIEKAKEKTVEKIEKEMKKMKSKQQRENFLKVLKNPEIEKLRVINELEDNLPSELLSEMKKIKEENIKLIQKKIKNNSQEQKKFIEKAKQFHDVSQFEILEEIGMNVNGKIKQVIDEAVDRTYEEFKNDIERAESEENKRIILEKLTTNQLNHIEVLGRVQTKLAEKLSDQAKAPEVLKRIIEMQKQRINSRIENAVEPTCKDLCGDGICQEMVCLAIGCPCAETAESCPGDCSKDLFSNAYFKFYDPGFPEETFIFKLTDPVKIQEARDILAGKITDSIHVSGEIIKEPVSYNPQWSYHLDPSTIQFFELSMEVCHAGIAYVESHLDEVCGSFLPDCWWCPVFSELIEEVNYPDSDKKRDRTDPEDCKEEIGYNLDEYYSNIDYSCNTDSDCVIKDVHNCCGYYPKCVNKDTKVDADYVSKACATEKMGSICGFPSINSCRCVQNKCEGFLK